MPKNKKKEQRRQQKAVDAADQAEAGSDVPPNVKTTGNQPSLFKKTQAAFLGFVNFSKAIPRVQGYMDRKQWGAACEILEQHITPHLPFSATTLAPHLFKALQMYSLCLIESEDFLLARKAAADGLRVLSATRNADFVPYSPQSMVEDMDSEKAQLLYYRGLAALKLFDADGAFVDLRAACILKRDSPGTNDGCSFVECMQAMLDAMGLRNLHTERPHYTKRERAKFNKELRLGPYAPALYVCALPGCSTASDLKLCSKCEASWYCTVDHQKQGWKKHKQQCKPVERLSLPGSLRAEISETLDGRGYGVLAHETGSWLLMRDKAGVIFDSLSDQNVFFF